MVAAVFASQGTFGKSIGRHHHKRIAATITMRRRWRTTRRCSAPLIDLSRDGGPGEHSPGAITAERRRTRVPASSRSIRPSTPSATSGRTLIERIAQQRASAITSPLSSRQTFVHKCFGNPLLLGLRAARPINIGARAIVIAIEKQHARP